MMTACSAVMRYRQENGRTYHAYKDGRYLLPNDQVCALRAPYHMSGTMDDPCWLTFPIATAVRKRALGIPALHILAHVQRPPSNRASPRTAASRARRRMWDGGLGH